MPNSLIFALVVVSLWIGIPKAFRTFENQMRIDANVYLVVGLIAFVAFVMITNAIAGLPLSQGLVVGPQ